jgi:hypothetical protein
MVNDQNFVPLTNTLPTMVNNQIFRTPNKHVTHYTMVNDQTFRTPNKHATHYGQRPDFRTPNKHVTYYGQRSDFPYT